jgi:hypothetical protein
VSIWSFIKLAVALWLLRKAARAAGWLLLFAVLIAAWPLTLVVLGGYIAAWWRGWPPAQALPGGRDIAGHAGDLAGRRRNPRTPAASRRAHWWTSAEFVVGDRSSCRL